MAIMKVLVTGGAGFIVADRMVAGNASAFNIGTMSCTQVRICHGWQGAGRPWTAGSGESLALRQY